MSIDTTAPKHWLDSDGVSHEEREADVRHHTEFLFGWVLLQPDDDWLKASVIPMTAGLFFNLLTVNYSTLYWHRDVVMDWYILWVVVHQMLKQFLSLRKRLMWAGSHASQYKSNDDHSPEDRLF